MARKRWNTVSPRIIFSSYFRLLEELEFDGETVERRTPAVIKSLITTLRGDWDRVKRLQDAYVEHRKKIAPLKERLRILSADSAATNKTLAQQRQSASGWFRIIPHLAVDGKLFSHQKELEREICSVEQSLSTLESELSSYSSPTRMLESSMPPTLCGQSNEANRLNFLHRAGACRSILDSAYMKSEARISEREITSLERTKTIQSKRERDKEQAEVFRNDVRTGAKTVRKKLSRDHLCPYCGSVLGSDAQADHIHPISHGGQNTLENLVFACRDCNSKKTNHTIREFCVRWGRNRNDVEESLIKLGKRV